MTKASLTFLAKAVTALTLWICAYISAAPLAHGLTYGLLGLEQESSLGHAIEFFLYDTPKILLLLVLMVYAIGLLRAGIDTDRVREYLKGKGRGFGYVLGAFFGAVTPFCSCSSVPLFIGFTTARIPLGITMAFLITSPIINEVAVVLLWGLLGWKVTFLYVASGLLAGILGGLLMDALHAERWLQPYLLEEMKRPAMQMLTMQAGRRRIPLEYRHSFALGETRTIFRRVWKWVLLGVALGAGLHGFVPQEWFAENLGNGRWWSVPLAVAAGIPLYTNVTGIVPVMESLLMKGLPVGTTLAFCMSTVAASLPELLMLKQVMRIPLLALFAGFLLVLFTLLGWLFNALPASLF
ncbi:permease [Mailhella sp.]